MTRVVASDRTTARDVERRVAIVSAYGLGESIKAIAGAWNLSARRVQQILTEELGADSALRRPLGRPRLFPCAVEREEYLFLTLSKRVPALEAQAMMQSQRPSLRRAA